MPPNESRSQPLCPGSIGAAVSFGPPHPPSIVGMGELVAPPFRAANVSAIDPATKTILVRLSNPDVTDRPNMIVQSVDAVFLGQVTQMHGGAGRKALEHKGRGKDHRMVKMLLIVLMG